MLLHQVYYARVGSAFPYCILPLTSLLYVRYSSSRFLPLSLSISLSIRSARMYMYSSSEVKVVLCRRSPGCVCNLDCALFCTSLLYQ